MTSLTPYSWVLSNFSSPRRRVAWKETYGETPVRTSGCSSTSWYISSGSRSMVEPSPRPHT